MHGGAPQALQLAYDLVEGTLAVNTSHGRAAARIPALDGRGAGAAGGGGFSGASTTAVPGPSAIEVWSPLR